MLKDQFISIVGYDEQNEDEEQHCKVYAVHGCSYGENEGKCYMLDLYECTRQKTIQD